MRVKWEKRHEHDFVARVEDDELSAWYAGIGLWRAEVLIHVGKLRAVHHGFTSERAAKREAVRMWRALRGKK